MQLHQIDLVPGESIRVGNRTVTLVAVEGSVAQLHVDDNEDHRAWMDVFSDSGCEVAELAFA
jgi:hypothetical protein